MQLTASYYICYFILILCSILSVQSTTIQFNNQRRPEDVLYSRDGTGRVSGIQDKTGHDIILGGLFAIHTSAQGGGQCSTTIISRGIERTEAMLYAIDAINSDPNLLPNITLGYDIRDTCMSFNIALDETTDLLLSSSLIESDSCIAINNSTNIFLAGVIGAGSSTVSRAVASFLRLFNVPQVSYSSSSTLLRNRDRYTYFFRTIPSDDQQAQALIDIILNFKWDHISIIYSNNDYGEPSSQEIRRAAQLNNICIDLNEAIDESFMTSDFISLANKIANSSARVIVLFASINDVKALFREVDIVMRNEGSNNKIIWLGSDSWTTNTFIQNTYPSLISGMWGTTPSTNFYELFQNYFVPLSQLTNVRNVWFDQNYFNTLFNCSSNRMDCSNITTVSESTTYTQDPIVPLVIDAVYSVAYAIQSFLNQNCQQPFVWFTNNSTCRGQNVTLSGENLLQYLANVNFTSPTGNQVIFDNFGSVMAKYSIYNFQVSNSCDSNCIDSLQLNQVGVWDDSVSNNRLQFYPNVSQQFGINQTSGNVLLSFRSQCQECSRGFIKRTVTSSCCGTCDPCLGSNYTNSTSSTQCTVCPEYMWGNTPLIGSTGCVHIEESYLQITDPWSIVLIILAVIGLLAVAFVVGVFIWFWNTPIVKSSGREQMILLLIGLILCFLITIVFILKPSPAVCGLQRIGLWFSYSLILCALFIKLVRIARIFLQKDISRRPKFITPGYQILFTFVLVCLQMILVVISLSVVPPDVTQTLRRNEDNSNDFPVLIVQCTTPHIAVIIIQAVYYSALIIASNALAILTIRFPANFNESRYVASATFALGVLWIAFISIYFGTPFVNQSAVLSFTVQVSALAVLLCLFGPRVLIMIIFPDKNVQSTSITNNNNSFPKSNILKTNMDKLKNDDIPMEL